MGQTPTSPIEILVCIIMAGVTGYYTLRWYIKEHKRMKASRPEREQHSKEAFDAVCQLWSLELKNKIMKNFMQDELELKQLELEFFKVSNEIEQLEILNEKDRAEINKIRAEAYQILQSAGYSEQDKSRLLNVEIGKMRAEIKRMGMETQRLKEDVRGARKRRENDY
jgi:hypothetical protein